MLPYVRKEYVKYTECKTGKSADLSALGTTKQIKGRSRNKSADKPVQNKLEGSANQFGTNWQT